ncbi:hypothetical protein FZI91_13555 [Mycobacterium sp. CBMA271]|uniref:hypothetical protein n=1 Tax=unclassified Mycobacteroides TaxID=2618759 RepID=UPI0012DC7EDB|nr:MULTISPECIES: hypothetical protein [unclassified Mycobacteroides]MUM18759.1 hypothetical protein [Mycobacteroides sp. CBMA 326]MUM22722.1 hypothetical protein [Mycobacteroides sp. CBMA 271]
MTGTVRPDVWLGDKWSHDAILDMQARMAPEDISRMAREWKTIVDGLDSLFSTFLDDVRATIGESWSGTGAQSALSTMRTYVENSRAMLAQAHSLSDGLNVLSSATRDLQSKMTAQFMPAGGAPGENPGWGGPNIPDFDLWQAALNHVRTVYSGPAVAAGNAVAELAGPRERLWFGSGAQTQMPEAVDPPVGRRDEQAERAEEFFSRWGLDHTPQGAAATPLQTPPTAVGNMNADKGFDAYSPSGSRADDLDEDDVYANQDWTHDPLWRENSTRSAGFDTAVPTSGTAPLPLPPDRMPAAGATPTVAGAGGGPTPRPAGAMMPMMGMYPPHAGQRRGDENEHYSPQYLVNRDNTRELLGELPRGTDPVIGLWERGDDDGIGPPPRRGFRSR